MASFQAQQLVNAADVLSTDSSGDDRDPGVFENRWEGVASHEWVGPGGFWGLFFDTLMETETLRAFTYQSFVDSTQFFTDVTP